MTDYRDARNGRAIEAELEGIVSACDVLAARLRRLGFLLEPDVELTPGQASGLSDVLSGVGMLGAVILANDLDRTAKREGVR